MGGRCLCCCGMPHGCDWPAPRRVSSARRSDRGQRNSPGLNAQPGAPARAGASHGACNASECSPRLAQMRPSSQPTVHRLLKKHSDECATGDAVPGSEQTHNVFSRRLSLRTLQVPRAIQAGRVWVNWCVDMSPQPPTPTPPTPPPPALAPACLPPDSPAPVRKLPRLPGARPVWRLQEVGLRARDA